MVDTVVGSDPLAIIKALQHVTTASDKPLEERLKELINRHKVMIFIKGTPSSPRCGFTNTLLGHLRALKVDYDSVDILADDEIRQGLKAYSQWPTYPQIYVNGEFLGGLDIFVDLMHSGELQPILDGLNE